MKDKERLGERELEAKDDKTKGAEPDKKPEKPKDYFEHNGEKYKNSSYEKLTALNLKLKDGRGKGKTC